MAKWGDAGLTSSHRCNWMHPHQYEWPRERIKDWRNRLSTVRYREEAMLRKVWRGTYGLEPGGLMGQSVGGKSVVGLERGEEQTPTPGAPGTGACIGKASSHRVWL